MLRKIHLLLYIGIFNIVSVYAQEHIRKSNLENSWVKELHFEAITMPKGVGEITQVVKNPDNLFEIYLATKQSGLWYSHNNGASFSPILPDDISGKITAFAVQWNTQTIWIATQKGIFYSEDQGKNWISAGLTQAQNITHFVFLSDKEICVSSMGDNNSERGIFKTYDKGKNWKQTFGQVGVTDFKASDKATSVLYIATWDMKRTPFSVEPKGAKSGIYKSTDAGENWQLVTGTDSGFLQNNVGRISLALYNENSLYALVDNRNKQNQDFISESIENLTEEDFLKLDNDRLSVYITSKGLQEKYLPDNLKDIIRNKWATPSTLSNYLNASESVIGAELYHSANGGKTWQKITNSTLANIFYSKGYEVGALAVHPYNEKELFLSGVALLHSVDGGIHWNLLKSNDLSTKVYQLSVSPKQILYVTNQGFFESLDMGQTWAEQSLAQSTSIRSLAIGNPKEKTLFASIEQQGIWKMQNGNWIQISKEQGYLVVDNDNKYYIAQKFGNILINNTKQNIIAHNTKDGKQRFGKSTPLLISPQNNSILYTGSNFLYQSLNEGKQWNVISNDLTNGEKGGNLAYGTISAIAESPYQFGLLYTGSDDGTIYMSKNGGVSWQMIYSSFPHPNRVVCLTASKHKKNRVYAVLKSASQQVLLFKSENMGKTWDNLKANLPEENVNILIEDDTNEQLLYLGTENGAYVSFDQGEKWNIFSKLPKTSVSQLVINPDEQILYVGTQGRGIFRADISLLKELRAAVQDQVFYPLKKQYQIKHSYRWGNQSNSWEKPEIPTLIFDGFSSKSGSSISVKIIKNDVIINSFTFETIEGFNFIPYHLTFSAEGKIAYEKQEQKTIYKSNDGNYYLPQGQYEIHFEGDLVDEIRELYVK